MTSEALDRDLVQWTFDISVKTKLTRGLPQPLGGVVAAHQLGVTVIVRLGD